MRKSLSLTIALLCAIIPLVRGESKTETLTLNFSESDFSITTDSNGLTSIIDLSGKGYYLNTQGPGIPMFSVNYAIPKGYHYKSLTTATTQTTIQSPVNLADNPTSSPISAQAVPTRSSIVIGGQTLTGFTYPVSPCKYIEASNFNGIPVLHFQVCPFYYTIKSKSLHFISEMTVTITLEKIEAGTNPTAFPNRGIIPDYLKDMVANKQYIDSVKRLEMVDRLFNQIDYVIITTNALKTSFEPLIKWKRTKGVYAKTITIEDIAQLYPGANIQVKIKRCLHDYYKNYSLQYVLLAGDDTVVPVRGCKGYVKTYSKRKDNTYIENIYEDDTMPTDLYYACFGGNFEWDGNGNGIYGESDDGMSLAPSIYVTRAPVRTQADATAFVSKIIQYEAAPRYEKKILLSGTKVWEYTDSTNTVSDAEAKGRNLYRKCIQGRWSGTPSWFYDTYTSFSGGANYDFNATNLTDQIGKGYTFVDIMTHGNQTTWAAEKGGSYTSANGLRQTSQANTVVTTMACLTNAFDSSYQGGTYDPCLSESLIRNPSSGVIAYLGSSRYGWGYSGGTDALGTSLQYESYFYEYLFKNRMAESNFGRIVAAAKSAKIADTSQSSKWIQYALNPIGDPETPIYIINPMTLKNVVIEHNGDSTRVTAPTSGWRICAMSSNDNGNSYYKVSEKVKSASFNTLPEHCSICLTKAGYIPKVLNFTTGYLQNVTLTGENTFAYDILRIGSSVKQNEPKGLVKFESGTTNLDAKAIIIDCDTEIGSKSTVTMNAN